MKTTTIIIGSLLSLLFLQACSSTPQDNQPRKIEILFLGHNQQHHDSEKYMPMLASALANKGINFTYTADCDDLNTENLSKYDGLAIYANHDSITPSQEKAMLDFVSSGKGLIPIHCASYCFRNSEDYVKLVGAQFKSHETGTFTASFTAEKHPVTEGLQPFETWDETYVHHMHNPDRKVLMERVEGDHHEPWTWTRSYGKGRVFYTAYGHDRRTWGNPGFHELIQRGIVWAVGERVKGLWEQLSFPKQEFVESDNIANYERRPQTLPLQKPLEQPNSEKLIQVPAGFDIQLFAQEPDIINPIAMTWDERGRLWVVETVDYPNEVKGDVGDDRIKICEDTDGDGLADKFTIFADGLNIPTSIVLANGGVIISMAPHFYFLKDTDGDDKADVKEKIISGWGTYDTHAGPSNLKYGFDNRIWGTVGYSGFEGNIDGKEYKFRQGFYSFDPDGTDFEFLTSTSNNTWGLGFSETFDVFGSTANNAHSWYMAIPNRYYEGVNGLEPKGSKKIASYYSFHPITENVRQVDVFGGFTAAAGHNLYTARAFPKEYWNRMALVCEPTGHLLAQGVLEKQGAGFITRDGWNLLASSDEWVSPVHAEVGPDGAVWVADWYNFIIQHNPTPSPQRGGYQAENGKGNAHVNPLRDRTHGRIYRIVHKDAPGSKITSLNKDDPQGLVNALSSDNMFWRLTAQRLLVERGNQDVLPDLYKLVQNTSVDEIGLNGGAIHALWTIHGLGALAGNNDDANKVAMAALDHPAAGVRKAALQVLPKAWWASKAMSEANVLDEDDKHTQLAALLAIAELPADQTWGEKLYALAKNTEVVQDLWLSQAVLIAAKTHKAGFMAAYQAENSGDMSEIGTAAMEAEKEIPSPWRPVDNHRAITANWATMNLPTQWERAGLEGFNGRVMFYRSFNLPANGAATIHLGTIDESDQTFVNGSFVGETRNEFDKKRSYEIPADKTQAGENYVFIRVSDRRGSGGIWGNPDGLYVSQGDAKVSLAGEWKYVVLEEFKSNLNQSSFAEGMDLITHFISNNPMNGEEGEMVAEEETADPNAIQLNISVIKNQMKYDKSELVAEAGKPVEITFTNPDLLQHNLLIIAPGSLEQVGAAADELAQDPSGMEKAYVPDMPEVLFKTALVDPNSTVVLRFTAPEKAGDYPFVCTFPGHWRIMNGVLKVVKAGSLQ